MTDAFDRLAAALADRYRIERELGRGGMATVYLAEDLKHQRKVAVKVLHPDFADTIGAERFLAEIRTTANLHHPHIVPLFDSGAVAGTVFYVMPVVDGESLRGRLEREPRLPIADAVRLAGEVAGALHYAHRQGVIHRDIKPENILLQDGQALVADFGIALAVVPTESRITQAGLSLGTPEYMSPEQALGERELDARTDIYSLGVTLYEMLTGVTPFTGGSSHHVLARVISEQPVPPASLRTDLPASLNRTVLTAIAKDPSSRFRTAGALESTLRDGGATAEPRSPANTIGWRVLLVVVAGAVLFALLRHRAPAVGTPTRHALAVLPFVNSTRDTANAYLSDGISRDLVDKLSNLRSIDVRDPAASMRFKDPDPDLDAIARTLHVTDIITGRLEKLGNTLVVSVALHDVPTKSEIWSTTYQPDVTRDLYRLYADIADSVARRLQVRPADVRNSAGTAYQPDSTAHDEVLRARHEIDSRDPVQLNRAIALLSDAILRAPDYAVAWAGRATARSLLVPFDAAGAEQFRTAEVDVRRAISENPDLAEAHATLGFIEVMYYRDWHAAATEFSRAVELEPGRAETWLFRAWYDVGSGHLDSAVAAIRRAHALDPLSVVIATRLGTILLLTDSLPAAKQAFHEAIALDRGLSARSEFAAELAREGQCDAARALAPTTAPVDNQLLMGFVESTNALCGRQADARAYLRTIEARQQAGEYIDAFPVARIFACLGDETGTRRWLQEALKENDWQLYQLRADLVFRPYRSRPWMQQLLRQSNLL